MTKWFNINKVFKIGLLALILTVVVVSLGYADECPSAEDLRARYGAGCWSCLVFEKLTSAFLHAAKKGLPITAKAGATLLWLGCAIWFVFWALKNVSSFTQVQIGNILNDLIKFLFKVAIAYWFIVYGTAAINKYIVTPLLSVGAIIGQQFWDEDVKDYMEDWNEAFEPDDPQKAEEVAQRVEENNRGNASDATLDIPEDSEANTTGVIEAPTIVEPSTSEEIVQDLQKAFIAILTRQLGEIKNSCGGPCGQSCRHKSCTNEGHRTYVKEIMQKAGYGYAVDHYCQASITAAMNKLTDEIGGDLTKVLKSAGASCLNGISLGAVGDVRLCENGQQVYKNINVADTVYYHNVQTKASGGKRVGGGSGHHAVTYVGSNQTISFNGDSQGSMCNNYYYNVTGKVLCVSCLLRAKLEENPSLANKINKTRLAELANSSGYMSLINYEGGVFTTADGSMLGNSVPTIPEIKYTGPTEIMPKSVMNSMLGAMRAITNTVAENMVLGNAIMCYAGLKNGGAWYISAFDIEIASITNFFTWLQGAIIWVLGFMLLMSVGYYFIDISFKIGFAVLALPLVMGLWPFGITQDKLFVVISIIAKASACFAFMAVSTAFGMELVSQSLGGLEELYSNMETLDVGERHDGYHKTLRNAIEEKLEMFSISFLMILFSIMYFYKLVQSTCSDLVNKFFPDKAFGDSNPMHSGATMATSFVARPLKNAASLVGDIATHQVGKAAQGALKGTLNTATGALRATGHAIAHPMRAGRAIGGKGKQALKATGKGLKATGKGLKAAGHAIANPKETAKKAANATKEGIKSGAKSLGKGIVSGAKAVGGAIIHPLKTIGNAIMGKKRW